MHGVLRSRDFPYPARLEILLVYDNGRSRLRRLEAKGRRTVFSWRESSRVKELILDPNYRVLRWTPHYREEAEALVPHTKADMLLHQGRADEAYEAMRAALDVAGVGPDPYGLRFLLHVGLAQLSLDRSKIEDSRVHAQAALEEPHPRPDLLPGVHLVLAKIAKHVGDDTALRRAVEETATADRVAGGTGATEEAQRLLP